MRAIPNSPRLRRLDGGASALSLPLSISCSCSCSCSWFRDGWWDGCAYGFGNGFADGLLDGFALVVVADFLSSPTRSQNSAFNPRNLLSANGLSNPLKSQEGSAGTTSERWSRSSRHSAQRGSSSMLSIHPASWFGLSGVL